MIRAFAFDLDGTLMDISGDMTAAVRSKLNDAIASGKNIAVAILSVFLLDFFCFGFCRESEVIYYALEIFEVVVVYRNAFASFFKRCRIGQNVKSAAVTCEYLHKGNSLLDFRISAFNDVIVGVFYCLLCCGVTCTEKTFFTVLFTEFRRIGEF